MSGAGHPFDAALVTRVAAGITGREAELWSIVAALDAGRHLLLEGPPGTGKSTLLRAVALESGIGFAFVEGNAELTPARLLGWHDPSRVLGEGYSEHTFVDGPLAQSIRAGGLLYIEELNRVPEETLNVLVTVMSEGEIHIPRVGRLVARDGFRLVAAMNPFDAVGTSRIASAISDRMCRVFVAYQSAEEERELVQRRVPDAPADLVARAVALVRATRTHPDVRQGSSVRGAIDLTLLAVSLGGLRSTAPTDASAFRNAAMVALSGRVRIDELAERTVEDLLDELLRRLADNADGHGGGGGGTPQPTPTRANSADRDGPTPLSPGKAGAPLVRP